MSIARIAIIGGTGVGTALFQGEEQQIPTRYGDALVTRANLDIPCEVFFLARHGANHHLPPHRINYRANIASLRDLGVTGVFGTAAVGSLQTHIEPGDFVILDDFIDVGKGEVVTFFDEVGTVRHTDFSEPYNNSLRAILSQTSPDNAKLKVHHAGTYLSLSGPRYETPAEVRLFASWGADVVGMTNAPEAILCREAEIPYAAVGIVTNYACGIVPGHILTHAEVETQMASSISFLRPWLLQAFEKFALLES